MAFDSRELLVKINGDTSGFEKAIDSTKKTSTSATTSFAQLTGAVFTGQAIFAGLTTILHGVENALGSVEGFFKSSFESAVELDKSTLKLQRNFGLTAEQASGLIGVFDRFGISTDQVSKAFVIFQKNLMNVSDGESVGIKAISELGVATTDGAGHLRNMSDVLGDVADKFKNGVVPSTQAGATAAKLFGKAGAELIPVLLQGKSGIADLTKELQANGLVLDQNMIDNYKKYAKNQADLNEKVKGFKTMLGNELMPMVTGVIKKVNDWITANGGVHAVFEKKVIPIIKELKEKTEEFVKKATEWWNEHGANTIRILGEIIGWIGTFIKVLGWVTLPFREIIGVMTWWNGIVVGLVKDVIGWFEKIPRYISIAFTVMKDIIVAPFKVAFNTISWLWNNTIGKLKFNIPSWVPGIGGKGFEAPQLPYLAKGTDNWGGGMAIVGEQGAEVVNLPRGSQVIPNSKLDKMGGTTNLTVNVGMYAGMPVEKREIAESLWRELVRSARAQGVSLPNIGSISVQ